MTTEAKDKAVHFTPERSTDPVACGDKDPASVTFYAEHTTCPACLTAMGEPRVVSGTDAVAAPPERKREESDMIRMAMERAVRRFGERGDGLFNAAWFGIELMGLAGLKGAVNGKLVRAILAGRADVEPTQPWHSHYRYLGLAAPVETPAPPEPAAAGRCRIGLVSGGLCQRPYAHPGEHSLDPAPAAPAPGVGEGARELTFAEAMLALINGKAVQFHKGEHGVDWHDCKREEVEGTLGLEELLRLAGNKYRLAPEPLPAPAPRPSRVREMVDLEAGKALWNTGNVTALCERVIEATLEAVRTAMEEAWRIGTAVDRARVAMLGAEPRK